MTETVFVNSPLAATLTELSRTREPDGVVGHFSIAFCKLDESVSIVLSAVEQSAYLPLLTELRMLREISPLVFKV